MRKSDLSFEDFDYDKVKAILPEGLTPIPYIEFQSPQPEKLVKVVGYHSEVEAINRIREFNELYKSTKYQIVPNSITINDFAIIIPENCCKYLRKDEAIIKDKPLITVNTYEPFLYRFLDEKVYENNFFNNGELLISTFKRCQSQEIKDRQDIHENQNKIIIKDGQQQLETVIRFDYKTLLFCTSLAQENINNASTNKYGFKINKPTDFFDLLTRALVSKGIEIYEVLKGPCVYNNKLINIDVTGSNIINEILNPNIQGNFDLSPTTEYINNQAQNHILMNKPSDYAFENEYRYVWKLSSPINKNNVTDDVKINSDGSIIVRVPELVQFCERL